MVQDRRDLESEIASTEERIGSLQDQVDEGAALIEQLEEEGETATGSGQDCTLAAETGVEVLTAFIQVLELGSQGDRLQAQEEYADMIELGKDAHRATKACVAGLRQVREGEAELL